MKNVLVIAPHPDDETLGCGGTLLKHRAQGDKIHLIIVTGMQESNGFSSERILARQNEIAEVANRYGLEEVHQLDFPTAALDCMPLGQIIGRMGDIVNTILPSCMYLPFPGDVHSDHKIVFDAGVACAKWFRYPSVKRLLAYETVSETDFAMDPTVPGFRPNVFVDIGDFLEQKIGIMKTYEGELGRFPFPRSEQSVRSLAALRGVASGFTAAEAFILLRELI